MNMVNKWERIVFIVTLMNYNTKVVGGQSNSNRNTISFHWAY